MRNVGMHRVRWLFVRTGHNFTYLRHNRVSFEQDGSDLKRGGREKLILSRSVVHLLVVCPQMSQMGTDSRMKSGNHSAGNHLHPSRVSASVHVVKRRGRLADHGSATRFTSVLSFRGYAQRDPARLVRPPCAYLRGVHCTWRRCHGTYRSEPDGQRAASVEGTPFPRRAYPISLLKTSIVRIMRMSTISTRKSIGKMILGCMREHGQRLSGENRARPRLRIETWSAGDDQSRPGGQESLRSRR